jgi:hypothetical protein
MKRARAQSAVLGGCMPVTAVAAYSRIIAAQRFVPFASMFALTVFLRLPSEGAATA